MSGTSAQVDDDDGALLNSEVYTNGTGRLP